MKPAIRPPTGRLLYRPLDEPTTVIVKHPVLGLWLTEDGWTRESLAAGPFRPEEVVRALRLANTRVPQGCELGPWQNGLALFSPSPLPAHPNEWQRVDESWLPPSVSRYASSDIDGVVNETCCGAPADRPRVDLDGGWPPSWSDSRDRVAADWPELKPAFAGALLAPWNAHPTGSALWSPRKNLDGPFAVVDLPAPAAAELANPR